MEGISQDTQAVTKSLALLVSLTESSGLLHLYKPHRSSKAKLRTLVHTITPALQRLKQENQEFRDRLGYMRRLQTNPKIKQTKNPKHKQASKQNTTKMQPDSLNS